MIIGIDLLLEAIAPKTCKTCYSPLGLYESVYEYCNSCTLDWFFLGSDSVSELLIGERFNSFCSAVGFKMKEGSTKELIYKCKYSGRPHLLVALDKWFATNNKLPHDDVVLIPVPLHWKRKYKRGYNQAELLANGMDGVWHVEVDSWSLKRGMNKKSLTSSNRRSRSTIIKDVFYFSPGYCDIDTPVILINYVLTTGSTLRACRDILEKNGRTALGAAVLALA